MKAVGTASKDKREDLLDLTPEELRARFKTAGLPAYRANQCLDWVYEKGVYDFEKMTNLPKDLRGKLAEHFKVGMPQIVERRSAGDDGSTKLLLRLGDKEYVEAVQMPTESRQTVCISSQVGCKFHCAFCASGQDGFFRNLRSGEMLAQVLAARDVSPTQKLTNIVFMGIGEPFDNYEQVLRAVRTLNSPAALKMGARKITISTCGVVPKIEELSKEGLQVELSVSLHGANDSVRGSIMPVNRAYAVRPLIDACKRYAKKTKRAITFEYILIKGINASERDARDLAKLLSGMLCKVNLIPYNPIDEFPHAAPNYPEVVLFQRVLQEAGIRTTVRFSKGRLIEAACGQLRSVRLRKDEA